MKKFQTLAEVKEWCADNTGKEVVAFYNALPGVKPVSRFEDRDVAAMRIWKAMAQPVVEGKEPRILEPEAGPVAAKHGAEPKPAAAPKTKKAAPKPASRPAKAKATKSEKDAECRVDSVVRLASRKGGISLDDLMTTFGWLRHTARGFMSTLASKHGHDVKSAKIEGVRTYSI